MGLKKANIIIMYLRVCTVLCGGNIDTTILGRCLERGLAADSRLVQFAVVVKDAPGGIAKLTKLLSDHGARYVRRTVNS